MGIALKGPSCIKWGINGMASIALSWVTSPFFAGGIAFVLYWLILRFIIHAEQPVRNAFIGLPILFSVTTAILMLLIASNLLAKHVGTWAMFAIVGGAALLVGLLIQFVAVPLLRKWIEGHFHTHEVHNRWSPAFCLLLSTCLFFVFCFCVFFLRLQFPHSHPADNGL